MRAIVAQSLGQTNMVMWLLLAFAAVGITLGAVGIYGVVSYDVAQRTREIGIRAALGAGSGSIQALVLRRAGSLALAGIVVGGVAAALSARALESLVFGVEVRDPATYGGLCGLLMLVALIAAFLPARRAVRVDPVLALRSE
jgi:putative ABC transport system permease protein